MKQHPLVRAPILSVFAIGATFALFTLINYLILSSTVGINRVTDAVQFDFVSLEERKLTKTKKEMPRKTEPRKRPDVPQNQSIQNESINPDAIGFASATPFDLNLQQAGGMGGLTATRDPVPTLRVTPTYPSRASRRGTEGWVEVMFTITKTGATKDIQIVKEQPSGVFSRAAVKAIRKWKYKPQMIEGTVQERPGVRVVLKFELEN